MSARDDYPILVEWLAGVPMTGMNGDAMEIAVAQALDEIDRLRVEVKSSRFEVFTADDGLPAIRVRRGDPA